MPRLRIAAALALSCVPLVTPSRAVASTREPGPAAPAAVSPLPTTPRFGDEIAVRLVTVVVRVVDGAGNPVLGLTPGDFHVRVGRHAVPVAAVDWVAGGDAVAPGQAPVHAPPGTGRLPEIGSEPPVQAPAAEPAAPAPPAAAPPPGKLVVIFVQADSNAPSRTRGHLHTLPFTRELLAALEPADHVAVVGFDSHLKLWQDFTRDREPVPEAIYQAIRFGGHPPEPAGGGAPSLARHFDFAAARRAASPERGLEVTAEALAALPGEKVLVFLAWGLGNFGSMGTHMTPAFAPAVRALLAARTTVFVLDVTEADAHDLEIGLQGIAEATGGTYDKTNVFPALAVRQLARTISGYYVLTLDAAALPRRGGEVEVELRGRKGNVLLRPTSFPAGAAAPGTASR
jgi:VWFA-related protein